MGFSPAGNFGEGALFSGGHISEEARKDIGKNMKKLCVSNILCFFLSRVLGLKTLSYVYKNTARENPQNTMIGNKVR